MRIRERRGVEQLSKEFKQGWRFAADAARITSGKARCEDREHTSGGVFVAIDSNLGGVVDQAVGASRLSLGMQEESPKRG